MSLLEKYRVKVENREGAWWFCLQEYHESSDPDITGWYNDPVANWRLTSSFLDGWFVLPRFWFKSLMERINVAVRGAVDRVVYLEGLRIESERAAVMETELTRAAMEVFAKALVECEERR